jgi:hypothetical protein
MPGTAALWAAWELRRGGSPAGPLGGTDPEYGAWSPRVELFIDEAWVDITRTSKDQAGVYYRDRITINRGRADETSKLEPATCSFTLNNRDGRFSLRNPLSPYYGKIGRNTRVRVSVLQNGVRRYRFYGEISSWPVKGDISGRDVYVPIQASGITRRLQQGNSPLNSVLYRAYTRLISGVSNTVVGYWPLEDNAGSASLASGIAAGAAALISGTEGTNYTLADDSSFVASDPLPALQSSMVSAKVPRYTSTDQIQVRFLLKIPDTGFSADCVLATVKTTSPDVPTWELYYSATGTGSIGLRGRDISNSIVADTGLFTPASGVYDGGQYRVSIEIFPTTPSTTLTYQYVTLRTGESSAAVPSGTLATSTVGRATNVVLSPGANVDGGVFGHLSVQNTVTSIFDLASQQTGYNGESARDRIRRLCKEEGIDEVDLGTEGNGTFLSTVTMGPQTSNTLINLLQACEDTSLGLLYEPRDRLGMAYRTRVGLYNQAAKVTLNVAAHELADSLNPVDDDQRIRNDITVVRAEGSSARAELTEGPLSTLDPPDGAGRYDDEQTISLGTDDQLTDQAGWRLHLGTVDDARYPTIELNLSHSAFSDVDLLNSVMTADVGDRVLIQDPSAYLPPDDISVLILGYTETFDQLEYNMTLNCTPEAPYRIAVADDDDFGRIDTDGSQLAAAIGAAAAPQHVSSTTATQNSAATAVAVTLPAIAAGNTLLIGVCWESSAGTVPTITSVVDTRGNTYTTTPDVSVDAGTTLAVATIRGTVSTAIQAGDTVTITVSVSRSRWAIQVDEFSGLTASPLDQVASNTGSVGSLVSGTTPATAQAVEVAYAAFGLGTGRTLTLPDGWAGGAQVATSAGSADRALQTLWSFTSAAGAQSVTVGTSSSSTYAGVISTYRASASMNIQVAVTDGALWTTDPAECPFDIRCGGEVMTVTAVSGSSSPQTMTVTRSVNGVVKGQVAGEDVRLAQPAIISM